MASKIRTLVASKVVNAINELGLTAGKLTPQSLLPFISVDPKPQSESKFDLHLPVSRLPTGGVHATSDIILRFGTDPVIPSVSTVGEGEKKMQRLHFGVDKHQFTRLVLDEVMAEPEFWKRSVLFDDFKEERVVVEFSSPNIAKPFHVGHLRSTIIGNFVANLNEAVGNRVTRLNFLGDWGTQFGLLNVGVKRSGVSQDAIAADPMSRLSEIYVQANKDAEADPRVAGEAREAFHRLETGGSSEMEQWKQFRDFTIKELDATYQRLGVNFDEYHGESMYPASEVTPLLESLRQMYILHKLPDGREVVNTEPGRQVTLVKSDGSTLYLTRDLAAAIDRYKRYQFDKLYYVVDNAQSDHLRALFRLVEKMGEECAAGMHHVKFGRILGMSTRKGSAVLLKDVIDEAKEIVMAKQKASPTTRSYADETAEILAVTSILVNDMKQRRQRDYTFDWEKVMENSAYSGVRLQYTQCRLGSLAHNCGVDLVPDCSILPLKEREAMYLIGEIARFEEVVAACRIELEPCLMVQYLFQLSHSVNTALKVLPVKGQPAEVAEPRRLLFHAAHLTLRAGMNILGLRPLEEM